MRCYSEKKPGSPEDIQPHWGRDSQSVYINKNRCSWDICTIFSELYFVLEFPISETKSILIFAHSAKYLQKQLNISSFNLRILQNFGLNLNIYWLAVTKEQRKLEYKHIILGTLDEKSDLLNYFIILGNLYLWSCRRNNCLPLFSLFEAIVKNKYDTEKLIASQNNLVFKKKSGKWKPFINDRWPCKFMHWL